MCYVHTLSHESSIIAIKLKVKKIFPPSPYGFLYFTIFENHIILKKLDILIIYNIMPILFVQHVFTGSGKIQPMAWDVP